jgi:hypothetical protein
LPIDQQDAVVHQVLIRLRPEVAEALERAIRAVEGMDGRVLFSFPPDAIVASLAGAGIERLRREPGILSVDAQEIGDDRLDAASGTARAAMTAWNDHLARQKAPRQLPSTELSWDAPGRQPPDPPPHIQEMLRRREREMLRGDEPAPS